MIHYVKRTKTITVMTTDLERLLFAQASRRKAYELFTRNHKLYDSEHKPIWLRLRDTYERRWRVWTATVEFFRARLGNTISETILSNV